MRRALFLTLLVWQSWAHAASESVPLIEAGINTQDAASIQRGAGLFVNYCLSCHKATYMRYNRLTDTGLSEDQIEASLIFDDSTKVGDVMTNGLDPVGAKAMFGVAPPDLSVISRSRGVDWLYTYFLSFYKDESTLTGWNNTLFPNVAMSHVFAAQQGEQVLVIDEEHHSQPKLKLASEGTMSPDQYKQMIRDLVNYLAFMGEPAAEKRKQIGSVVLIFLILFAFLAWALKREFWKEIH
jgi:ubiquinol-cytochrome c reductase cytochrome c1 subunit